MLQKIKNELRMTVGYNVIFILVASIYSNSGIDKYLFEEIIDNICDAGIWLVIVSIVYLAAVYCWKRLSKVIKADMTELKTELNRKEIKA